MHRPITQDELNRLRAPFPLEAHSIREGNSTKDGKKTQWFCYLEKTEVETRLNEVFGGEWGSTQPVLTIIGNSVAATIGITIRGITRGNTGEDSNGMEKAKGATTDAFRRAAADWGVAKYLWEMELKIWTPSYEKGDWKSRDEREREALNLFKQWYQKKFAGYKPSNISPLPTESRQEGDTGVSGVESTPTTATPQPTPESAKAALGTPAKQTIAPKSGKWAFDRNALLTALSTAAAGTSYQERGNTVKKLDDEKAFANCASLAEATQIVVDRLATHQKATG